MPLPPTAELTLGSHVVGGTRPFALIAGPCVVEDREHTLHVATELQAICAARGVPLVFKASFDKANRTALGSFRGIGQARALAALAEVRERLGLPVTTDVHEPAQAAPVAEAVDLLQVPAFLCRQTDLLLACAATGRPVNVKKGQFLAPWDMGNVVAKLRAGGAAGVILTERGASFGYNNLVVDPRALPILRGFGVPVCFDATHAVQLPGGQGERSGGQREFVAPLARAAVAVGVDLLFLEVHPDPDHAPSDGPNMLPLTALPALLDTLLVLDRAVKA